jgi:peptidoglycan/xylan/chitin deacetylase (PgdA/CDA1 family)
MDPAIEVRVDDSNPDARFVLETLLTTIGYRYRVVEAWKNPALRIVCSSNKSDDGEVQIPIEDSFDFVDITHIEDTPVVYARNREPPTSFWNNGVAQFDLIRFPFRLLSRQDELFSDDQFRYYDSILYDLGIHRRPILNYYAQVLEQQIERQLAERDVSVPKAPRWPDQQDFAVALTHDVDVISATGFETARRHLWTALRGGNISRRRRLKSLLLAAEQVRFTVDQFGSEDPAWNFEQWLEIESRYDVRSTFFVAAPSSRTTEDPTYDLDDHLTFEGETVTTGELFGHLEQRGWEIGLHGSIGSHESVPAQKKERATLESATGAEVTGVRQHYLKFNYPETWQNQASAGFGYDSTLGFNKRFGHRAGLAFPYFPYDCTRGQHTGILQLPITIHDNVPLLFEYSDRERALERCLRCIDEVAETNGLATLLWHPYTRHHPRWPEPVEVYADVLEYLDGLDAYIATAGEIARWWCTRRKWIRGERDELRHPN